MNPTLEDAIALATRLHKGQVDRAGQSYIEHPLRVMSMLETEVEKIAGVLHDVVEDCDITFEELGQLGYSDEIVEALSFVTKLSGEERDYESFIARVATGPVLAINVKMADLRDNLDLSRIKNPDERDLRRAERYRNALALLEARLAESDVP